MRRGVLINRRTYPMLMAIIELCACSEGGDHSGLGASASGATATTQSGQHAGGHGGDSMTGKTMSDHGGANGVSQSNSSVGGGSTSFASGGTQHSTGGAGVDASSFAGGTQGNAGGTSAVFRVIGYQPSWSGNVDEIQYDKLTAINYAFASVNASGKIEPVENTDKLDALVELAHRHGVEVFISIGGWNDGDDSAFHAIAGNETARDAFVEEVLTFVQDHQLDGADIDWEYPDAGQSARDYSTLMTLLATRLHDMQKKLTAAVVAVGGAGIEDAVFAQVDYLNLMAYDGGDGSTHSPYSYAVDSLDYWLNRGLPKEKCVLGVPFYGRPSWKSYASIVAQDPDAPNKDLSNGTYYNGIATIEAKTRLARERASGIMIWELSQDTSDSTSLLRAIDSVVR